MKHEINLNDIFIHSDDVVARQIEDEYIIIPMTDGIGNMEDCMFSLNDIGKKIWDLLDGKKDMNAIIEILISKYDVEKKEIIEDVTGFLKQLAKRNLVSIIQSKE